MSNDDRFEGLNQALRNLIEGLKQVREVEKLMTKVEAVLEDIVDRPCRSCGAPSFLQNQAGTYTPIGAQCPACGALLTKESDSE